MDKASDWYARKVASCTVAFKEEEGRGAATEPHGCISAMVSKTTFDCLRFETSTLFLCWIDYYILTFGIRYIFWNTYILEQSLHSHEVKN